MPLYLKDAENLPPPYDLALPAMASAIGSKPVNPATAMELIRVFVAPILSEHQAVLLELEGQPSWERIHFICVRLLFESNRGANPDLLFAAIIINTLFQHTTRPPRELAFPRFVEVSSFARVCGYLGLPVAEPIVECGDRLHHLYSFCKYCWLPVVSHGVCTFHSTKAQPVVLTGGLPACGTTSLKQGQRLLPAFEKHVLALTTTEELAFHDADFDAPIFLPSSGLRNWLKTRRPTLAATVGEVAWMADEIDLDDLLIFLYGVQSGAVAEAIGTAAYLLTPVTTRAEAWLAARATKPRWGGVRRRAQP